MIAHDADRAWRALVGDETSARQLGCLWGKSAEKGGGHVNLLLQHLFDAMAVGELIWDRFIAPGIRNRLDSVAAGGDGRRLYAWLCGLHDIGKASPAFQRMQADLAVGVRAAGLPCPGMDKRRWRHEKASAFILQAHLETPWSGDDGGSELAWIWPLVAGHHGLFPQSGDVDEPNAKRGMRELQGEGPWAPLQGLLLDVVTVAAGWPTLRDARPSGTPARADQLALAGFITMADWIASDAGHFSGIGDFESVGIGGARDRAERAWRALGLRGGWGELSVPHGDAAFVRRFRNEPRPAQKMVTTAAQEIPAPGLLLVEAPMGEGKTEAALAAAEVLAARFGCDGLYIAMPTQATSDAMFDRVREWMATFEPVQQVALLHGRRLVTGTAGWVEPGDGRLAAGHVDMYGQPESLFTSICEDRPAEAEERDRPAEWFYGRRRGLLAANGVGTIDQALFAATRTKYVALRYAGLAGKVVVFDEVHAADTYMSQFLGEVLWWLGNGGVPVVLLSATLSPGQRDDLVHWYLAGSQRRPPGAALGVEVPAVAGYPSVTTAWADKAGPAFSHQTATPWRPSLSTAVTVCEEADGKEAMAAVDAVRELVGEGGCALVVHNTVDRAQASFRALRCFFGEDVVLLHSRFTAAGRARKTQQLLDCLGADGQRRPRRLVVVATQVAEQSFDVDADVLVTELAPVDLLLQRAGRVHRHERPSSTRPEYLRDPRIVVTGVRFRAGNAPWFPRGSEVVYGRHHLLAAAAAVSEAAQDGWSIPADVPALVAAAYADTPAVPEDWLDEADRARAAWRAEEAVRRDSAKSSLLARAGTYAAPTLAGLHGGEGLGAEVEAGVQVRDGEMGVEVLLVQEDAHGWRTVEGLALGPTGEAGRGRRDVLGSITRLPTFDRELGAAIRELTPLPGWNGDPWLGDVPALCFDRAGRTELAGRAVTYDDDCGVTIGPRR